jgi:hypothetical protein
VKEDEKVRKNLESDDHGLFQGTIICRVSKTRRKPKSQYLVTELKLKPSTFQIQICRL